MDKLIYTAMSSISESGSPRQQLNNEIANLSTPGFKSSFSAAMKTVKVSGPGFDSRYIPTSTAYDRISLAPGPRMYTGVPLDIAMNGNTVLGVTASNGELAFTRRGDLRVGSNGVVENGSGQGVRGENGPITAPPGYSVEVTGDGSMYAVSSGKAQPAARTLIGKLLLRDASETPLERREDGLFTPAPKPGSTEKQSGADIKDGKQTPSISVGALEGSNVSTFGAMTRLLDYSRSYEANIKFIKEAKTLDESGASMMKA